MAAPTARTRSSLENGLRSRLAASLCVAVSSSVSSHGVPRTSRTARLTLRSAMTAVVAWLEAIVRACPRRCWRCGGGSAMSSASSWPSAHLAALRSGSASIGDFGRARQRWDTKAFLSVPLTCVLIIATGYIGSFIVLVPGAQTFESLKDLAVLLCIVLFGYPALIAVLPAYMLSDLIEGVPPGFVLNWAEGYFFWAAFVWMAYQLIGRNPDFRRAQTWRRYGVFVVLIMLFDPVMWGYICSEKFTSAISYRNISSALVFTLSVTWLLGPVAFLVALPLARRFGWFWADIPGHVRERAIGSSEWIWESGRGEAPGKVSPVQGRLPIRIFIFAPFIALVLADGWRHGDRRASDRRRRCADAGDKAPSGDVGEHPLATGRLPRTSRRRQASSAKDASTPCCEVRPSAPMVEPSSLT